MFMTGIPSVKTKVEMKKGVYLRGEPIRTNRSQNPRFLDKSMSSSSSLLFAIPLPRTQKQT
jgi:hypothetical protein